MEQLISFGFGRREQGVLMPTRRIYLTVSVGPSARVASFVFEMTRDDSSDLGADYTAELISGDTDVHGDDWPDVEAAAIEAAKEEWAAVAKLKGAA